MFWQLGGGAEIILPDRDMEKKRKGGKTEVDVGGTEDEPSS